MDTFEAILKRRSYRSYSNKPVEQEKIAKLLEAGRMGPSAANIQPCHFIYISDPSVRSKLSEAYPAEWLQQAPVIIVVCADTKEAWKRRDRQSYWLVDGAIAMQNIVLTATELGLATCWIAALDEKKLQKIMQIPKRYRVVAMTPVGYSNEQKEPITDRKPLEDLTHKNKW